MYWRASAIICPQAASSALTPSPTKDRIASTTTATAISRLKSVISSGSVAGRISRVIVCQWVKPSASRTPRETSALAQFRIEDEIETVHGRVDEQHRHAISKPGRLNDRKIRVAHRIDHQIS